VVLTPGRAQTKDRERALARPAGYRLYEQLFSDRSAPFAFVDMDALWSNGDEMIGRAGRLPIRVATKSVRSRAILRQILDRSPRFQGLMTFTLGESVWLANQGLGNILLAYPTTDHDALKQWADLEAEDTPAVMVDSVEHLDLLAAAASAPRHRLRVCVDIDMSYRRAGDRVRFGPLRSPLGTAAAVVALLEEIGNRPQFELAGLMGYEGHIAGVGDQPAGRPLQARVLPALQKRWIEDVRARRAEIVAAAKKVAPLGIVNAGGTGSLHLNATEKSLTEVTAGSGFFAPVLFDGYRAFRLRPAAFFVLPVVRRPSAEVATVLGGGYIASGAVSKDRAPVPWLPQGLKLDAREGAGEVQTPLHGPAARRLRVGDRVYFRHAKAGELCERFNSLLLVSDGKIVDEVPTYRGEGKAFL
jgi:D-serine deaminase-like pyridoxal phosphate-dependent protein